MQLSNQQKKNLRAIGHKLNPVVTVAANGLSEPVLAELERALNDHELIKVKLRVGDHDARDQVLKALLEATGAVCVQQIGAIALLLRPARKPDPRLSNLLRAEAGNL